MNTKVEAEPSVVTKISVKTVGADPALAKLSDSPVHLMRVIGMATGIKDKEDARGEAITAILGDFEGTNPASGEVYRSGVLYLPSGIHEMIVGALGTPGAKVEFGLDIFSVKATNRIGYSYTCKQIFKSEGRDSLADLREKVGEKVKALAPPAAHKK